MTPSPPRAWQSHCLKAEGGGAIAVWASSGSDRTRRPVPDEQEVDSSPVRWQITDPGRSHDEGQGRHEGPGCTEDVDLVWRSNHKTEIEGIGIMEYCKKRRDWNNGILEEWGKAEERGKGSGLYSLTQHSSIPSFQSSGPSSFHYSSIPWAACIDRGDPLGQRPVGIIRVNR